MDPVTVATFILIVSLGLCVGALTALVASIPSSEDKALREALTLSYLHILSTEYATKKHEHRVWVSYAHTCMIQVSRLQAERIYQETGSIIPMPL